MNKVVLTKSFDKITITHLLGIYYEIKVENTIYGNHEWIADLDDYDLFIQKLVEGGYEIH